MDLPFLHIPTKPVVIREALQSCTLTDAKNSVLLGMQNRLRKTTIKLYVLPTLMQKLRCKVTWLWGSGLVNKVGTVSSHHSLANGLYANQKQKTSNILNIVIINTHFLYINSNNTTSQCGSRFRGIWGDLDVGKLTTTGIPARNEADSNRPTKQDFVKTFYKRGFCENIKWKN